LISSAFFRTPRRPLLPLVATAFALGVLSPVPLIAQVNVPGLQTAPPDPVPHVDAPPPTHATLAGSAGSAGTGLAQAEQWTLIQAHVLNGTAEPQTARLVFRFMEQPQRQFIRETWVPAKARRTVVMPVRFGAAKSRNPMSAETETLLTPIGAEREWSREPGLIRLVSEPQICTMLTNAFTTEAENALDDEDVAVLSAARMQMGLGRSIAYFSADKMIRFDAGWAGVNVLGVTARNPPLDAAQRRSVRHWLEAGGTLLIFADLVQNEPMQLLLGDRWGLSTVDQVTLTMVKFEQASNAAANGSDGEGQPFKGAMETESPITMTRLTTSGNPAWKTLLSVNGWPALLERSVGHGRVLVATVGGRAWVDESAGDALRTFTDHALPQTMQTPGSRPEEVITGTAGQQFVSSQIGYKIVSRQSVGLVMFAALGLLIVAALVWGRARKLEYAGVAGAVVSIAAAGLLLGMGQHQRGQVAPTAVAAQWIEAGPDTSNVRVKSLTGIFQPDGANTDVNGTLGGWAWPDRLNQSGPIERVQVMDLDRWAWPQFPVSAGAMRPLAVAADITLPEPLRVNMQLGPEGLTGQVRWPAGDFRGEDAVLAAPHGNMRVATEQQPGLTQIKATPGDVLEHGVILGGTVIAQQQQDRAALLNALLDKARFDEPTLLLWSPGLDTGVRYTPPLTRRDQSLWSIPIHLDATPAGTGVTVPWPLVAMEMMRDRDHKLPLKMLPLYRADQHKWIEQVASPSAFLARFVIPEQVLPLKLTSAKVHLNLVATGRPVVVLLISDGKAVPVKSMMSPDGEQVVDLPVDQVRPDAGGGVMVAFDVQKTPEQQRVDDENDRRSAAKQPLLPYPAPKASEMWGVRYFGLEVAGTVAPKK
jgi:hypothetical protein